MHFYKADIANCTPMVDIFNARIRDNVVGLATHSIVSYSPKDTDAYPMQHY